MSVMAAAAAAAGGGGERSSTRERLLAALEDLELLARYPVGWPRLGAQPPAWTASGGPGIGLRGERRPGAERTREVLPPAG